MSNWPGTERSNEGEPRFRQAEQGPALVERAVALHGGNHSGERRERVILQAHAQELVPPYEHGRPAACSEERESLKSQAWVVQPGVMAAG